MQRRYDANAVLCVANLATYAWATVRRLRMQLEIARAEGCPRAGNKGDDRCMLGYDIAYAPMFKGR